VILSVLCISAVSDITIKNGDGLRVHRSGARAIEAALIRNDCNESKVVEASKGSPLPEFHREESRMDAFEDNLIVQYNTQL